MRLRKRSVVLVLSFILVFTPLLLPRASANTITITLASLHGAIFTENDGISGVYLHNENGDIYEFTADAQTVTIDAENVDNITFQLMSILATVDNEWVDGNSSLYHIRSRAHVHFDNWDDYLDNNVDVYDNTAYGTCRWHEDINVTVGYGYHTIAIYYQIYAPMD